MLNNTAWLLQRLWSYNGCSGFWLATPLDAWGGLRPSLGFGVRVRTRPVELLHWPDLLQDRLLRHLTENEFVLHLSLRVSVLCSPPRLARL